jgi:hypothetical protein
MIMIVRVLCYDSEIVIEIIHFERNKRNLKFSNKIKCVLFSLRFLINFK